MNLLSRDELKSLMQKKETPCVSIYMPTYRTSPQTKQNPIRLKNLLKSGKEYEPNDPFCNKQLHFSPFPYSFYFFIKLRSY